MLPANSSPDLLLDPPSQHQHDSPAPVRTIPFTLPVASSPPQAVVTNTHDVLLKFTASRPFLASSSTRHLKFNPDTFTRLSQEHEDAHNLHSIPINTGSIVSSNQMPAPTMLFENVATFEKNTFFQDPDDPKRIFSCCNDAMNRHFVSRGFVEIQVSHFTGAPEDIPRLPTRASVAAAQEQPQSARQLLEACAPATSVLPAEKVALWQPGNTSLAFAIMHAFDVKVYDAKTEMIYSPYRLWTHCNKTKFRNKVTITKYCQAYFTFKHLRKLTPSRAKQSTEGLNAASALAVHWLKLNPLLKNRPKEENNPVWFSLALSGPPANSVPLPPASLAPVGSTPP
jgi:hypothetical protein